MMILLVLLGTVICVYSFVTDSYRIRDMAESYLSDLLGGRVVVRSARLSIFEGLKLEGVEIYVDDGSRPDSLLFSAQALYLNYDPFKIIQGKLEAARIVVQKPHVYLTQDTLNKNWNFYRLGQNRPVKPPPLPPPTPGPPPPIPELLMRNARVDVREMTGGVVRPVGYEALDGRIAPLPERGEFAFELQARGEEGVGPWASGRVSLTGGAIVAELHDFQFGRDVRSLLWDQVRAFTEHHGMAGTIDVLSVTVLLPHDNQGPHFQASMKLKDVDFAVTPDDWLTQPEIARRRDLQEGVEAMQGCYRLAGYRAPAQAAQPVPPAGKAGGLIPIEPALAPGGAPRPTAVSASRATAARVPSPLRAGAQSNADAASSTIASPGDALERLTGTIPIALRGGSGTFIFSDQGVELHDVSGSVEGNAFVVNAAMHGYSPDAPFTVKLESLQGQTLHIPMQPRYITSLPPIVRDIYSLLRPDGRCTLSVKVDRATPGAKPVLQGEVDVVDGEFSSAFFPYPLWQTHGRIVFGHEPSFDADFVHIVKMRGRGAANGPNRNSWIEVDGDVGPLRTPDPQIVVRVKGENIYSEAALIDAFPPEVQNPLRIFDADHTGKYPTFHGDFSTTVLHRENSRWLWTFDTDLHLDDASGKLQGFPYLLEHVQGDVHVRDGYVDIINAHCKRGPATLNVNGRVTWGAAKAPEYWTPFQLTTDVQLEVHDLPIDRELLNAIPRDQAKWIERLGLGGRIDCVGRVYQGLPDPANPAAPIDPDDVRFDLNINLHDGTLWPADGTFSVSSVSGACHLTPEFLELSDLRGQRGSARLSGDGAITWSVGSPQLALHVNAKDLQLDAPLYAMLPPTARQAWDAIQPRGALDADLTLRDEFHPDPADDRGNVATRPATAPAETASAVAAARLGARRLAPPAQNAEFMGEPPRPRALLQIPEGFNARLEPRGMTFTLKPLPYRIDDVTGAIAISPQRVTIENVTGHRGSATLHASGTGMVARPSVWDLKFSATDLTVDDELRKALPGAVQTIFNAIKLLGKVDVEFPKFVYRGDSILSVSDATKRGAGTDVAALAVAAATDPSVAPRTPDSASASGSPPATASSVAATAPAAEAPVDIDLAGTLTFKGSNLDVGVPMSGAMGQLKAAVSVRDSKVAGVTGSLDLPKINISGRDVTDLTLQLFKPDDQNEMHLNKLTGVVAGGQVAGEAALYFPDDGPSRYLLSAVVRNADVQALVQGAGAAIRGELTASVALEGRWDTAAARRGRGDVTVSGQHLYQLPLLLGLFQVTNLSLPIATPFKTGAARYSIEGERINFERVELKSDNMMMSGVGHLDFKTRKVQMTFTTDNPSGFRVPFLNDLLNGARGELLKFNIRGTIQAPKVQADPFGTFTTTIDEVFRADRKEK